MTPEVPDPHKLWVNNLDRILDDFYRPQRCRNKPAQTADKPPLVAVDADEVEQPVKAPIRRGLDPEIKALADMDRILSDLTTEQATRCLDFLHSRHVSGIRFTWAPEEGQ